MPNGVPGLSDALSRLDQDIADTERRLAELRAMRESIQPFIERYVEAAPADMEADQPAKTRPFSFIDEVTKVFEDHPAEVMDVDDALAYVRENTPNAGRDSVRNAINYAVRQGKVLRDSQRRGRYILKSTSTPVAAGVDVGEEPDQEGSSREERGGYRDETSTPPHDQAGSAYSARFSLDRTGGRTPIVG